MCCSSWGRKESDMTQRLNNKSQIDSCASFQTGEVIKLWNTSWEI